MTPQDIDDSPLLGERVPDEGLYRPVQTEGGRVRGFLNPGTAFSI
jgi:hypothetical protein